MKLTLTRIVRKDTDKEGNKLVTQDGRPYTRLGIQTREHGAKWISGFSSSWNESWKEGQEVEADVVQKGEYLNLVKPNPLADFAKTIMALSVRFGKLEERVKTLESRPDGIPVVHETDDIPGKYDLNDEIDPNLPF